MHAVFLEARTLQQEKEEATGLSPAWWEEGWKKRGAGRYFSELKAMLNFSNEKRSGRLGKKNLAKDIAKDLGKHA